MTDGSTVIFGIEIPSTDPIFLAVVVGIHLPLGLMRGRGRGRDV
jgi:hypothetical protein